MSLNDIINNIDTLVHIATFLEYYDLLNLFSACKHYAKMFTNASFWDKLLGAQGLKRSRWREFPMFDCVTPAARYFELISLYGRPEPGSEQFYHITYRLEFAAHRNLNKYPKRTHIICRARSIAAKNLPPSEQFNLIEKLVDEKIGPNNLDPQVIKCVYATRNRTLINYMHTKYMNFMRDRMGAACLDYSIYYMSEAADKSVYPHVELSYITYTRDYSTFATFMQSLIDNAINDKCTLKDIFSQLLYTLDYVKINTGLAAFKDAKINIKTIIYITDLLNIHNVTLCLHILPHLGIKTYAELSAVMPPRYCHYDHFIHRLQARLPQ
jgi:hypothetical protein